MSSLFRNQLQTGCITILCGSGLNPLDPWKVHCRGCVRRLIDEDVETLVYELTAAQFCTTYISLPRSPKSVIGIRLPFMTMVVKNMKMPFCFEFQILDDRGARRRFRASNCHSRTTVSPLLCHMPLALDEGWNKVQIDLASSQQERVRISVRVHPAKVFANCRMRRIFFSDRWYKEDELPNSYRLKKPTRKTRSRLAEDY
ncbi:hypothetical protein JTE90_028448 [Oedothorax gibbosus]|uniref:CFA20 domain-containing protein n=1 Tax=Oedothorax gibbosus TaxID=931172 RepID=A0AAV6VHY5_9ARAC|nr:hypothetical protein JTE90_028448 [Oedothorax gibbosus]